MLSTTTLIVALTVGLCGGVLVISAISFVSAYLVRRHWLAQRKECEERVRIHASSSILPSSTGAHLASPPFRPYINPEKVEEDSSPASLAHVENPAPLLPIHSPSPTKSLKCTQPRPSLDTENLLVQDRGSMPTTQSPTSNSIFRSQTLSSKYKLNLSRASVRNASLRCSRMSQNVLSRLPSQFRSNRSSRQISLESGESLGMPEDQIPMARRIQRKEQRFQYDSSSYSSSVATPEGCLPESEAMMPPPPAMLKSDSPRNKEALFDRIMAWQETSAVNVSPDSDEAHSDIADLPSPSKWRHDKPRLQRQVTQSSMYSMGSESMCSHTTISDVINPYMQSQSHTPILRIPSIRPQFMAETSLESWLGPEDPRRTAKSGQGVAPSPTTLFREVPMAAPEVNAHESVSAHTAPSVHGTQLEHPRTSVHLLAPPETPSPKRVSLTSTDTKETPTTDVPIFLSPADKAALPQPTSYTPSNSSRSSYRSSARFSGYSPQHWKHLSSETAGTEITWVEEAEEEEEAECKAKAVEPSSPPSPRHSPDRPQNIQIDMEAGVKHAAHPPAPRRDVSAATMVEAIGYAYDPTDLGSDVYAQTPRIPSARYPAAPSPPSATLPLRNVHSSSPDSADSESVATERDSHSAPSTLSQNAIVGSPMQTMQAWFQMAGEKTPLAKETVSLRGPRAMV